MSEGDDLDDLVRRADPDRWLASRFVADADARADLISLYAFGYELSRAAEVASQPLVGEIRLTWWIEAVDEIFDGRPPRRHPAVLALARAADRRGLARQALVGLAEGRFRDLEGWPLGPEEVEPYIDATAGALMALAAGLLAPGVDAGLVRHAARAHGLAGLERLGRLPPGLAGAPAQARIGAELGLAREDVARLPVAAFPAVAYAALARGGGGGADLGRRLRLTWAVVTGRL